MDKKVFKFPSIEQFRTVIGNVNHKARFLGLGCDDEPLYDEAEGILPTLDYRGSVKLHGTNAGIVYRWNMLTFEYETQFQSRTNIITPDSDNAGFARAMSAVNTDTILKQIMRVKNDLGYTPETVRVFGEWCGKGIQKKVGICEIDKMFVIFAVKVDDIWLTDDELKDIGMAENRIFNILTFPTYEVTIDFNDPKIAAETMSQMVEKVEKECPVAKAFGVDNGTGEGIVWVCTTEGWRDSKFWFKTKGEEHKVSKTKDKVPVDIERVNSINALVDVVLAEGRLEQGLAFLKENDHPLDRSSTGHYVKWVVTDVEKEELDTITENGFTMKDVGKSVSDKARKWFFKKLDSLVGL